MASSSEQTEVVAQPVVISALVADRVASIPEVPLNDTTATMLVVQSGCAPGAICSCCCHWVLPVSGVRPDRLLTLDGRKETQFGVALRYHEWIVYHLHIVTHQGLDRRMQVYVA